MQIRVRLQAGGLSRLPQNDGRKVRLGGNQRARWATWRRLIDYAILHGATKITMYGYVPLAFRSYYFPLLSTWVDSVPDWAVVALTIILPVILALVGRMVLKSENRFAMIAFAAGLLLCAATLISYGRAPTPGRAP